VLAQRCFGLLDAPGGLGLPNEMQGSPAVATMLLLAHLERPEAFSLLLDAEQVHERFGFVTGDSGVGREILEVKVPVVEF
jgi:hypothetical protein